MKNRVFLDSNLLIYSVNLIDQNKNQISQQIIYSYIEDSFLSVQVLNEVFSVLTKKKLKTIQESEIIINRFISDFSVLPLSPFNTKKAIELQKSLQYSFWDCLMLSSALLSGCSTFYTEDLQDGQIIENQLKVVNPFIQ